MTTFLRRSTGPRASRLSWGFVLWGAGLHLSALPAWGGSGTNAFPFLRLSPDARASALGESAVARPEGPASLFFNPAGLSEINGSRIGAQHLSYVEDIAYDHAAFGRGDGESGWGVSVGYLRVGKLTRTVYDAAAVDRFREEAGGIQADDIALSAGYARRFRSCWRAGFAAKVFQERLDAARSRGAALDAGLLIQPSDDWTLGAAMRNAGTATKFADADVRLPLTGDVGVWFHPWDHGSTGLQASQTRDEPLELRAGAEFRPLSPVFLRMGYKLRSESNDLGQLSSVSFGGGLAVGPSRIDYAFHSLGDFGAVHRVSLLWSWGPGENR